MKKSLLTFAIIALVITVNAQTIALHSSTGVQIFKGNTALVAAYSAANNTDTLYLSGHTFVPPTAFNKQLMIFGTGHYVDSTIATGKTFINGSITLSDSADLFYIEGLEITGNFIFSNNHAVNSVNIKRCKINGTVEVFGDLSNPSTNLSLIGNVFMGALNLNNATNVLIANNIFQGFITATYGNQITNNVFMGGWQLNTWVYAVFSGDNNQLNNNVFVYTSGTASGAGNSFSNNLFVMANPSYGTTSTAVNNYTGIAQSAIFVNQSGNLFNYTHDYNLKTPATYIGTDSTVVGVFGGTFPYKAGAVPLNPHVQFKSIAPATDVNGGLNIQIKVKAQTN